MNTDAAVANIFNRLAPLLARLGRDDELVAWELVVSYGVIRAAEACKGSAA